MPGTLETQITERCGFLGTTHNRVSEGQGAASLKWTFGFLWLFTMAVLVRPEDIYRIPFHFQLIFAIGAAVAFTGALFAGRATMVWPPELVLVLSLTGWFALGVPFAYWRTESYTTLTGVWLKTVFIFFLLTQSLKTVDRVRKLIWAVVLSELIVASVSLALQARQALQEGERLAGVSMGMLGWNEFGIAFATTIPYIAALYLSRRSLVRTCFLVATLGTMTWMLVLIASRGGFLTMAFSIVSTWYFVLRRTPRGQTATFVIGLCLFISLAKAPSLFFERMQTIWSESEGSTNRVVAAADESTEGRKFLLERAITYTLRYPIFGVGLGNFQVINGTELRQANAWLGTHNTFTQISSEAGIPALVLFLSLLFTLLRHMKKLSDDFADDPANADLRLLARASLASIISFAFGAIFAHVGYQYYFFYPAGIATGLWLIAGQIRQSRQRPRPSLEIPTTRSGERFPK